VVGKQQRHGPWLCTPLYPRWWCGREGCHNVGVAQHHRTAAAEGPAQTTQHAHNSRESGSEEEVGMRQSMHSQSRLQRRGKHNTYEGQLKRARTAPSCDHAASRVKWAFSTRSTHTQHTTQHTTHNTTHNTQHTVRVAHLQPALDGVQRVHEKLGHGARQEAPGTRVCLLSHNLAHHGVQCLVHGKLRCGGGGGDGEGVGCRGMTVRGASSPTHTHPFQPHKRTPHTTVPIPCSPSPCRPPAAPLVHLLPCRVPFAPRPPPDHGTVRLPPRPRPPGSSPHPPCHGMPG
jgi:hypothetical protein